MSRTVVGRGGGRGKGLVRSRPERAGPERARTPSGRAESACSGRIVASAKGRIHKPEPAKSADSRPPRRARGTLCMVAGQEKRPAPGPVARARADDRPRAPKKTGRGKGLAAQEGPRAFFFLRRPSGASRPLARNRPRFRADAERLSARRAEPARARSRRARVPAGRARWCAPGPPGRRARARDRDPRTARVPGAGGA